MTGGAEPHPGEGLSYDHKDEVLHGHKPQAHPKSRGEIKLGTEKQQTPQWIQAAAGRESICMNYSRSKASESLFLLIYPV